MYYIVQSRWCCNQNKGHDVSEGGGGDLNPDTMYICFIAQVTIDMFYLQK